jgi:CHASE1-domain containing sensor protein
MLDDYTLPAWLIASSAFAPLVAAKTGAFSLSQLAIDAPAQIDDSLWQIWWAGDAVGALIITPVLLTLNSIRLSLTGAFKVLIAVTLCLLIHIVFVYVSESEPLIFLICPLMILTCRWFGPAGCALTTLAITASSLSILSSSSLMSYEDFHQHTLRFDIYLVALGILSLIISAIYRKAHFLLPTIILVLGLGINAWIHREQVKTAKKVDEILFHELIADAENAMKQRLRTYVDLLRGSSSYYLNSNEVTREEWRSYVSSLELKKHYPGVNGMGYAMPFSDQSLLEYVDLVRTHQLPDFRIKAVPGVTAPLIDEPELPHYIVTLVEPKKHNHQALGLNLASEINRRTAARRARDSGQPVISDRIALVQDGKKRAGFLLYLPMYKEGAPLETIAQRRAALVGWSYLPFITEYFFQGVLATLNNRIDIQIYDGPFFNTENKVYTSSSDHSTTIKRHFGEIRNLNLADKTFTFSWKPGDQFHAQKRIPTTIAAASLATGCGLMAAFLTSLQTTNRRAKRIVERTTTELTDANGLLRKEVN